MRRGREFLPRDDARAPIVILVNETLARRYFPNQDPLGRTTNRGTIVGVVGDVRQDSLGAEAKPEVYYTTVQNFAQIRRHGSTLVVRGRGPVESLAGMIRTAVREVSPGQALFRVATMQQVIHESLANPRLYTWLLGLFAGLSLLLAVAGIYGVIAYLVSLRTQEFGIRMALGADAGQVVKLVMQHGAALTAMGLALGVAGAAALTRVLRTVLYGVGPTDPVTFGVIAVLLACAALAGCGAPARRAARVDPATALRRE